MQNNANSIFKKMERKQLDTNSGPVAYWVSRGESAAAHPPLVLLHGLTADHTLFTPQAEHFYGRFPLVCWDAPAHGDSRPYCNFTYRRAADHLYEILRREGLLPAVLVGQSMGGFLAQTLLKYHPEAVLGFVGIDTAPFGLGYYSPSDRWWLRQVEWMSALFPNRLLVNAIASGCACTAPARENMRAILTRYQKRELCHLMGIGYAGFLAENCDLTIDPALPVLLLLGHRDRIGKVRQYCRAWQANTGYPLHVIDRAAHNANFDNPGQVNAELEDFLQRFF